MKLGIGLGIPVSPVKAGGPTIPANAWRKPDGTPWTKPDGTIWLKG